ncbi:tellurium resistance protein TerZ [Novosphingobium indicum]|uniref:Tellurium resistance protein TerZ n=1 Tax=Novosphingobium indicum TaxID=462949 RepID=A0ABQ2K0I9_9SPHN|nr:TerD family protein [Novosphingobium indicum]GGN60437.1 tellurium resistance protein TerZ [Novosphingobium indicum]
MSISLEKGQKVSLTKESANLSQIFMGLGWDVAKKGGFLSGLLGGSDEIDLDASCLVFDEAGELIDVIFYNNLNGVGGLIVHTGDNRTGEGDGDDEAIIVNLDQMPSEIKSLVFIVSSYEGHTFDQIANAYCRVVENRTGRELVRYDISDSGRHTGMIMSRIYRHNGEWKIHAIGNPANGRTPIDMVPAVVASL